MYGTGAIVNPMGNPHDGIFEIVLLIKRDWAGVINLGLTAFDKTVVETFKDYTKNYTAKSARIKFDKPRMLQLDGEVIGECESIEAVIIPGGAKFITTSDNHFIDQLRDK
jgi:diacylglycerol kinase family enzyme